MMATKKKRRKPRYRHMRFRKNDPSHNLLAATQHWVKANGGGLVLIGHISIYRMPSDMEEKFGVLVGCLGKAPPKPPGKEQDL